MRLTILVSLIFTLFTTSCSNDDDNNGVAVTRQNLLGKWYLKGGTINNGTFQNYTHDCSTSRDFQEFFDNDILTYNGHSTACDLNEVETSNWILNGNTITVSNTNFDTILYEYFVIESLTSTELVLKQNGVNEQTGEDEVVRIYATRD